MFVVLLNELEAPKQTLLGIKSGIECPQTSIGKTTELVQLPAETINKTEYVPEVGYVFVGAFVVLSIEPLLVKSHDHPVIEPVGVDKSVKAVARCAKVCNWLRRDVYCLSNRCSTSCICRNI